VIGDKGFWGRDYAERLATSGTILLTPDKTRTAANLGREVDCFPCRLWSEPR